MTDTPTHMGTPMPPSPCPHRDPSPLPKPVQTGSLGKLFHYVAHTSSKRVAGLRLTGLIV